MVAVQFCLGGWGVIIFIIIIQNSGSKHCQYHCIVSTGSFSSENILLSLDHVIEVVHSLTAVSAN